MKRKLLIIALFATVLSSSAHLPDSLYNIISNKLFEQHYIKFDVQGDVAPYVYSNNPGMQNADTVFYVNQPGVYKVFFQSYYNPTTQYQIDVIIENRYGLLKSKNGVIYQFDGKTLQYKSLRVRKIKCE